MSIELARAAAALGEADRIDGATVVATGVEADDGVCRAIDRVLPVVKSQKLYFARIPTGPTTSSFARLPVLSITRTIPCEQPKE